MTTKFEPQMRTMARALNRSRGERWLGLAAAAAVVAVRGGEELMVGLGFREERRFWAGIAMRRGGVNWIVSRGWACRG
jgi:hypothetical protein